MAPRRAPGPTRDAAQGRLKPLVIDGPRMSDIAEADEALALSARVRESVLQGRPILGVHLWTHSPKRFLENEALLQVLAHLRDREVPIALQVTVTGLGATALEPGIEPVPEAFESLDRILQNVLPDPGRVCLRIDPLQRWVGPHGPVCNLERVNGILEQARSRGIHRVRVSLVSYERYRSRIDPRLRARGFERMAVTAQEAGGILRPWLRQGMDIRTCASDLAHEGIPPGACFDFAWVTGLALQGLLRPVAARRGCLCFYPESVLLWKVPRRSSCRGRCLACYAQDHL
jgi:hypothetical protein